MVLQVQLCCTIASGHYIIKYPAGLHQMNPTSTASHLTVSKYLVNKHKERERARISLFSV